MDPRSKYEPDMGMDAKGESGHLVPSPYATITTESHDGFFYHLAMSANRDNDNGMESEPVDASQDVVTAPTSLTRTRSSTNQLAQESSRHHGNRDHDTLATSGNHGDHDARAHMLTSPVVQPSTLVMTAATIPAEAVDRKEPSALHDAKQNQQHRHQSNTQQRPEAFDLKRKEPMSRRNSNPTATGLPRSASPPPPSPTPAHNDAHGKHRPSVPTLLLPDSASARQESSSLYDVGSSSAPTGSHQSSLYTSPEPNSVGSALSLDEHINVDDMMGNMGGAASVLALSNVLLNQRATSATRLSISGHGAGGPGLSPRVPVSIMEPSTTMLDTDTAPTTPGKRGSISLLPISFGQGGPEPTITASTSSIQSRRSPLASPAPPSIRGQTASLQALVLNEVDETIATLDRNRFPSPFIPPAPDATATSGIPTPIFVQQGPSQPGSRRSSQSGTSSGAAAISSKLGHFSPVSKSMVESINTSTAGTATHFAPPHSSGVSNHVLDPTRSVASISASIPLVNTHVYASSPPSSDTSFSVRSIAQSLQGSAGGLRDGSGAHGELGHAHPGGLESIQSSLSIPQMDAPGSTTVSPQPRRMMPARGSGSSSGQGNASVGAGVPMGGIRRSASAVSQHSNAGGAGAAGGGGAASAVSSGGMPHSGTKSVEASTSDFHGSRAMTLDEVGLDEVDPLEGESPLSWLSQRIAHWTERWKFHRKDIFENPNHAVWWVYDCIIRCADIYNMIALTTLLGFVCDFEFSNFIPWFFIDLLHVVAIPLEVNRPKFDRFGQLITKPAEKRQAYFSEWSSRLEIIAMLPADWAIVLWGLPNKTLRRCDNPMYVYNRNVFSPTPLPMQTPTGIRFAYEPNDIPKQLFYYAIARAFRLLRCGRTFEWMFNLRIPKMAEAASRLLKTLVFSVFLSHVDSCMFWILSIQIDSKRKWTIATDVIYDEFGDLTPFSERYSRNFYGAQKALYFMPREIITTPEIIFQCVEMLFAAVLYGSIFGNLASIVRSLDSQAAMDKAAKARNFKRSFLIKYMRTNRFPPTLQLKILEQEEFEWIHKCGMDTDRLFLELPKSIREEVNIHLYHGLVSNVPIFKEHAPEVFKVAMCQRMSSITVTKDFYVCKAGEAGNEMYFLRHGSVEILTPDESRVLVTLGSGSFFGEVALFMPNNRRTATARTTADTELCVLKKEDFDDILRSYPEMIAVFQQEIERRAIANKKRQEEEEAKKKADEMRKRVASFNLEPGRLRGRQRSHQQSGNSSAFLSRFARQPSASFSASKRGTLGRSIVAQDAAPSPQASAPPSPLLRSSTRRSSSFHDAEVDVHQNVGGSAHGVGPRRVSGQHIIDKALGSVTSLSSRGGASRSAVQHHVAAVTGSVVASTGIVNGGGNHGQGHEQ